MEVETPYLLTTMIPEAHIDAIEAGGRYLQTSPEQCMKMLLAQGFSRIFQICRCFRKGERGGRHMPEFTMLEWYRAGSDYFDLMDECEAMIRFVAKRVGLGEVIAYGTHEVNLSRPWQRMRVREAMERFGGISLEEVLAHGSFDQVMVESVEPRLGLDGPTFLYDYPASTAALARLSPKDKGVSERFELYAAGIELANGFSELTDPEEQRARFLKEVAEREERGAPVYPMPEQFLKYLERMPESAGVALGVDRLVMFLAGKREIDDVVAFAPEEV